MNSNPTAVAGGIDEPEYTPVRMAAVVSCVGDAIVAAEHAVIDVEVSSVAVGAEMIHTTNAPNRRR